MISASRSLIVTLAFLIVKSPTFKFGEMTVTDPAPVGPESLSIQPGVIAADARLACKLPVDDGKKCPRVYNQLAGGIVDHRRDLQVLCHQGELDRRISLFRQDGTNPVSDSFHLSAGMSEEEVIVEVEHHAVFEHLTQPEQAIGEPIGTIQAIADEIGEDTGFHVHEGEISHRELVDRDDADFLFAFAKRAMHPLVCFRGQEPELFHARFENDRGRGAGVDRQVADLAVGVNWNAVGIFRAHELGAAVTVRDDKRIERRERRGTVRGRTREHEQKSMGTMIGRMRAGSNCSGAPGQSRTDRAGNSRLQFHPASF